MFAKLPKCVAILTVLPTCSSINVETVIIAFDALFNIASICKRKVEQTHKLEVLQLGSKDNGCGNRM